MGRIALAVVAVNGFLLGSLYLLMGKATTPAEQDKYPYAATPYLITLFDMVPPPPLPELQTVEMPHLPGPNTMAETPLSIRPTYNQLVKLGVQGCLLYDQYRLKKVRCGVG